MKYLVEVETVVGGEIIAAGTIVENPETVVAGMVAIKEEAPKAKPAKVEKVEEVVEVKEEILVEDSADVAVEVAEEPVETKSLFGKKKKKK